MIRAKKHLGQHFLRDETIAHKIVQSLENLGLPLLEVGPGMGILTQHLVGKADFYAAEVDSESVIYLRETYPQMRGKLLEGDVLKMDLKHYFKGKFSIIGNFPYNISSQIFFKVLACKDQVEEVVCMVQKEVAERIAAPPGSKTYGILSVLLQAYYRIDYLFTVHEHVFDPPPKVKSAIIRLKRNDVASIACDENFFLKVVKMAFGQRRKTLRNSLKPLINGRMEIAARAIFDLRPERLTVDDFVFLTHLLEKTEPSVEI